MTFPNSSITEALRALRGVHNPATHEREVCLTMVRTVNGLIQSQQEEHSARARACFIIGQLILVPRCSHLDIATAMLVLDDLPLAELVVDCGVMNSLISLHEDIAAKSQVVEDEEDEPPDLLRLREVSHVSAD